MACKIIFDVTFTVLIFAIAYGIMVRKPICNLNYSNMSNKVVIVTGANAGIGLW